MNIVVDYETMAEGLHKAPLSTDLKELRNTLIILAGYNRWSTFFSSIESI